MDLLLKTMNLHKMFIWSSFYHVGHAFQKKQKSVVLQQINLHCYIWNAIRTEIGKCLCYYIQFVTDTYKVFVSCLDILSEVQILQLYKLSVLLPLSQITVIWHSLSHTLFGDNFHIPFRKKMTNNDIPM